MQQEAAITINGRALSQSESKSMRVAVTAFADVLYEPAAKTHGVEVTSIYATAIRHIRRYLGEQN